MQVNPTESVWRIAPGTNGFVQARAHGRERLRMPAAYEILPEHGLLYIAGQGLCTGTEYLEVNRRAACDPRRRPGQTALLDVQHVTQLSISPDELRAIIEADHAYLAAGVYGTVKTALLARSANDVEVQIGQLYNVLVRSAPLAVKPTSSLREAVAYLGLSSVADEVCAVRNRLRARLAEHAE